MVLICFCFLFGFSLQCMRFLRVRECFPREIETRGENGASQKERGRVRDVTKTGNGERGAGSGERGAGSGKRGAGNGERGTEVLERVVSGNLHKNTKWPIRIKNPVRSMIEKRQNNT